MKLRSGLIYLAASMRAFARRPDRTTLGFALRYAHRCISLYECEPPDFLATASPWMCFPAIERLDRLMTTESRVFEYGSGGSTIYFANLAREVVSIEHEASWHRRVLAEIERRGLTNVRYELVEPVADAGCEHARVADPAAYVSDDDDFAGKAFKSYVQTIDAFPNEYFDLVVVDGRARPSCILHARDKVRPGGVLLLDQSERRYYLSETAALLDPARWSSARFMAPLPYSLHFTEATFFTKRVP
jgi:predicted O-methyltransferase YrrM